MGRFVSPGKILSALLLALAFAGGRVRAAGEKFGFEPSYWKQSMDGTVRADGSSLDGTDVELQDGLGLEDQDKLPAGRFWIRFLQRNPLTFSMDHSRRNGSQVLTVPLIYNDQVFAPGEEVASRVETDLKSLVYGFNFLSTRLIQMGVRLGVDRFGLDTSLESPTASAGANASATFPVVGLNLWFEPMPAFRFIGELDGSTGTIHGNAMSFYDGRIQAEIYWWRSFGITAGYRRVKIDAQMKDFGAARLNQKGPYAGLVFRF